MKPRIALYGGSFDPIHHGHLILARDAMERWNLQQVIFIPAAISPHKPNSQPAPAQVRVQMIAAAIAEEPGFTFDALEVERQGPSYTVDTAQILRERHPSAELFYLIGQDHLAQLHTWHRIEDLRQTVQFLVFDRGDSSERSNPFNLPRRLDISATEIRQRVAQGASIRYLVPEPVRLLIEHHHLYQEPHH